jgi:hypothetical protein
MKAWPCVLIGTLLLAPAVAEAEDEGARATEDREDAEQFFPETASHLPGAHGLTGFGSVVDGRVPTPFRAQALGGPLGSWSTRFSLRYVGGFQRRRVWTTAADGTYADASQALILSGGMTVQGLDITLGIPYSHDLEQVGVDDAPDPGRERAHGTGDLTGGFKLSLKIPNMFGQKWATGAFAPYVLGRVPTGAERVEREASLEAGIALAGPYGHSGRYVANLAWVQREGGVTAMVYRFGVSIAPVAEPGFVLRTYVLVDGTEYEGSPNSTVFLSGGIQALLGDRWSVDLGLGLQLTDSERVDPALRRAAERDLGGEVTRVRHEGGFEVTFGVGLIL